MDELASMAGQARQPAQNLGKGNDQSSPVALEFSGSAPQGEGNHHPNVVSYGAEEAIEDIYEGTVGIIVQWPGTIRTVYQFIDTLVHSPHFRVLQLIGTPRDLRRSEVLVELRQPLNLKEFFEQNEVVYRVMDSSDYSSGSSERKVHVFLKNSLEHAGVAFDTTPAVSDSQSPSWELPSSSFGYTLLESGVLPLEEISNARTAARAQGVTISQVLLREGKILPIQLAALMALHLGLTLVDLRGQKIDHKVLTLLPEAVARRNNVIPVQMNGSRLTVAMADPSNLQLVQELSSRTGTNIDPVISTPDDIREHIEVAYRLTSQFVQELRTQEQHTNERVTASDLVTVPPAQIIDLLLRQALQDRASDVHIVPSPSQLRVRFRIDGILHDTMDLPLEMQATIISRLKIISGMNIAERRRSQDGQFTFDVENRTVDVRVAVSKTVHGEMTVLRLLDKRFTLMSLDQLGMGNQGLERYQHLLRLPHGMLVVSGPTGSGKSTTLYASVLQLNRTEQNVITIEDPVEYHISSTNQMQVNNEAGISFGNQLRSILRLDPDVILVGEIRDQETAIIATQAALTGHLVLTSIHANDSVSALLRLRDLGVPPYLIASSVAGIVAQRMVRVVCKGCQTVKLGSPAEKEAYATEINEHRERFTVGSGCNMCAHTGYRGRTGVFEILSISDHLRQLFLADAPRSELWSQALKDGTAPLRQDGMLKVKEDITTPYEVMRLLSSME